MVDLLHPSWWDSIPEDDRRRVMNGCGPAGWKASYIPDTIWGVDVSTACDVHDCEYAYGNSRSSADARFLANLCLICADHGGLLTPLRILRAFTFFTAVRVFGAPYYKGV